MGKKDKDAISTKQVHNVVRGAGAWLGILSSWPLAQHPVRMPALSFPILLKVSLGGLALPGKVLEHKTDTIVSLSSLGR